MMKNNKMTSIEYFSNVDMLLINSIPCQYFNFWATSKHDRQDHLDERRLVCNEG